MIYTFQFCHEMEKVFFFTLLAICKRNPVDFPHKGDSNADF